MKRCTVLPSWSLNEMRACRAVTLNVWCVAGRYYPLRVGPSGMYGAVGTHQAVIRKRGARCWTQSLLCEPPRDVDSCADSCRQLQTGVQTAVDRCRQLCRQVDSNCLQLSTAVYSCLQLSTAVYRSLSSSQCVETSGAYTLYTVRRPCSKTT